MLTLRLFKQIPKSSKTSIEIPKYIISVFRPICAHFGYYGSLDNFHSDRSAYEQFHSILSTMPRYKKTTFFRNDLKKEFKGGIKLTQSKVGKTLDDNIDLYLTNVVSFTYPISFDRNFGGIISRITENIGKVTDDNIIRLLKYTSIYIPHGRIKDKNILKLLSALDKELVKRLGNWDIEIALLISDICTFYTLYNGKLFYLSDRLAKYLSDNLVHLEDSYVVQTLLHQGEIKSQVFQVPSNFTFKLGCMLSHLTLDEVGVICFGLFRNQFFIQDLDILREIVEKFIESVEHASSITPSHILKILSQSMSGKDHGHYDLCYDLLSRIKPYVKDFDHFTSIRLLNLGNHLLVYDMEMQISVFKSISTKLDVLRLKDIESLLLALLNHGKLENDEYALIDKVAEELRSGLRQSEKEKYFYAYAKCVYYLTCLQIFDEKNISEVMSTCISKMDMTLDSDNTYSDFPKTIYRLHMNVNIECHLPMSKELPKRLVEQFEKEVVGRIPNKSTIDLTKHEAHILDIYEHVKVLTGSENFSCMMNILPHFQHPDIVICTKGTNYVPASKEFARISSWDLKRPVDPDVINYTAVVVAAGRSYTHQNKDFTWVHKTKIRQLKKLGFDVTVVEYKDLLGMKSPEKKNYLAKLLLTSLSSS